VDEKATQLHAIASLKVLLDATKPQRGAATSSAANHVKINLKETTLGRPNGNIDAALDSVCSAYFRLSRSSISCIIVDMFC
jgi:solute carrier family 24 (sodium/potassium/calcium exchanger), member 2